jgi:hypothetical protein
MKQQTIANRKSATVGSSADTGLFKRKCTCGNHSLGHIECAEGSRRPMLSEMNVDRLEAQPSDDVDAALRGLVFQAGAYRRTEQAGHLVVFPQAPVWDMLVTDVRITDLPRLEAARKYIGLVRTRVPSLTNLFEPPMKRDPSSPIYTQPVSLQLQGSIVQHFGELLGSDRSVVFTVERLISGARFFYFDQVPQ